MAIRYCGDVKINMKILDNDPEGWSYWCVLTTIICDCEPKCPKYTTHAGLALCDRSELAEDNPLAFDAIARAALSFADADGAELMRHAHFHHSGKWILSRNKKDRFQL